MFFLLKRYYKLNSNLICYFLKNDSQKVITYFYKDEKKNIKYIFQFKYNQINFFLAFDNSNFIYLLGKQQKFVYRFLNLFDNLFYQFLEESLFYRYLIKTNVIGLGYKNFILHNCLYILVGDANYIILSIPAELHIFCRKKHIYLLGNNKTILNQFYSILLYLKKINIYKGKGLIRFNNFKFMKLKVGKKQRF